MIHKHSGLLDYSHDSALNVNGTRKTIIRLSLPWQRNPGFSRTLPAMAKVSRFLSMICQLPGIDANFHATTQTCVTQGLWGRTADAFNDMVLNESSAGPIAGRRSLDHLYDDPYLCPTDTIRVSECHLWLDHRSIKFAL